MFWLNGAIELLVDFLVVAVSAGLAALPTIAITLPLFALLVR